MTFSVKVRIKAGPLTIDESIIVESGLDILTLEKEAERTGNFDVISSHLIVVRTGEEAIDLIYRIVEAAGGR